jgi:hypothetical protein
MILMMAIAHVADHGIPNLHLRDSNGLPKRIAEIRVLDS